jgi:hypothetical protein
MKKDRILYKAIVQMKGSSQTQLPKHEYKRLYISDKNKIDIIITASDDRLTIS